MIDIPSGVRVYNPEEQKQISAIENTLASVFSLWGYDEIGLPYFEYYDVHKIALGENLEDKTFRFIDRYDGKTLVLRADFTAQIARYAASLKKIELPLKLYYRGTVFRYEPPKKNRLWEIKQAGIELIGSDKIEADAEIIAIAIGSMEELGIKDFQVDINNVAIFYEIKKILNLSDEKFKQFMSFIKRKELFSLKRFVDETKPPSALSDFILELPFYQGDVSLLEDLKIKLKEFPTLVGHIDRLIKIKEILDSYEISEKVIFDLSEPREFSYYTGIVFEIFTNKIKQPLGSGGRYDNLISKFNGKLPAVGAGFDINAIWEVVKEKKKVKKDFFIVNVFYDKSLAYKVAQSLRKKGYKVGRDLIDRPIEKSLEYAFSQGYDKVIVLGVDNNKEKAYLYSNKEKYTEKNIEELFNL